MKVIVVFGVFVCLLINSCGNPTSSVVGSDELLVTGVSVQNWGSDSLGIPVSIALISIDFNTKLKSDDWPRYADHCITVKSEDGKHESIGPEYLSKDGRSVYKNLRIDSTCSLLEYDTYYTLKVSGVIGANGEKIKDYYLRFKTSKS